MKISEIKSHLKKLDKIAIQLPDGRLVPRHFHVTEIGKVKKHFIDCGGNIRNEEVASFQLWEANDNDHRLHPEKLISIIQLSQQKLGMGNLEIEIEYQGTQTIGKYELDFDGERFLLKNKFTTCLAKESCGVEKKPKLRSSKIQSCAPGTGCC